jgi:hypothetical protein
MRKYRWAVLAGICTCGLLLSDAVCGQTAGPAAVDGAASGPIDTEASATEHPRAESFGEKTGLRIFEREKPQEDSPAPAAPEQPIATLTEEAQDWLGALASLWKQWQESDTGREFKWRSAERRGLFASRSFIREHDADKSGQVSCAEAPPDFEEAFVHWDADHDGQLSRAEVRRHARLARRPSAEPVETVYAWMMQADSGRMKKESLQQAYDQLQRLDQNADGAIDESALASKPEPNATDRRTASRGLFGRRR